jgi:ATP-dependent Clp protease ATP-binding subunit ClpC
MKSARSLIAPFRFVLLSHRLLSRNSLHKIRFFAGAVTATCGVILIITFYVPDGNSLFWLGATLFSFGMWLDIFLITTYHNSRYYHGIHSITGSKGKETSGFQYLPASALLYIPTDSSASVLMCDIGKSITQRLGLSTEDTETFVSLPRKKISIDEIYFDENKSITLLHVAEKLFDEDISLQQWLLRNEVNKLNWLHAVALVEKLHNEKMQRERWWSRDNLSRKKSLGTELAFGHHYFIESVSRPFSTNSIVKASHPVYDSYVSTIAEILAKEKSSNVLLIGTEGGGVIDVLNRLQYQFSSGQQLRSLHHPYIYEIDIDIFFSRYAHPDIIIEKLITLFNEATSAGNVILAFNHFGNIITRCESIGINFETIIDDYLASNALHIIAIDTPQNYHSVLRLKNDITRHFTEVIIDHTNLDDLRSIVTDYIIKRESEVKTIFTISAIEAVVLDANRYLTVGEMPERAITLADSILTHADRHKLHTVTVDDVHQYVRNITNIPIGPISNDEAGLLMNLETHLATNVAGQPRALAAIARTMRRARANIERQDRPIGSFLFLGPTGVGKTETAKTLARIFFSSDEAIARFDMSEFSQFDSLNRMIGTATEVGFLTSVLTSTPYTVILLDEFEKAHQNIHDLFLQILDEGFYTTGAGEKINARNTIIIATSNAASDLISNTHHSLQRSPHLTVKVIEWLTSHNIFRPELINRFDNTIIFEPLNENAMRQVVIKFLDNLLARVNKGGYIIGYDESIVSLICAQPFNQSFGARPIQRFIQNLLEDYFAKGIIEKRIVPGQEHIVSASHFSKEDIERSID